MLLDVSQVLSVSDKQITTSVPIEMKTIQAGTDAYKIVEAKPVNVTLSNKGKRIFRLEADIRLSLEMPCNRCLDVVKKDFDIQVLKEIDVDKMETLEGDSITYIEENQLDVDSLVYDEVFVVLPMKVLCSENCKGICNRCGTNLNQMTCECDTTELDPRMAKILDVFNQFKEV